MIRVKSDRRLIDLFIRLKRLIGGNISLSFIRGLINVFDKIRSIQKHSGDKGVVLYLKALSVCLQQSVSGYRLNDLTPLKSRISRTKGSKIPRIIPPAHRRIIEKRLPGYLYLIRLYLTLFYMYRVLNFKPTLKLNTITDNGKSFNMKLFEPFMTLFIKLFTGNKLINIRETVYSYAKSFTILKASPASGKFWSTHPIALLRSIWSLKADRTIYNAFISIGSVFSNVSLLSFVKHVQGKVAISPLGKLGFKEEAAGKLRVFAMVDPLTQWMLYPLHKFIFSVLRRIPMDGTHNQLKPLMRLLRLKCKRLYSLDLSAATDRLPVVLQAKLLDYLFNQYPGFGTHWMTLLVGREYVWKYLSQQGSVRYSVGQPMGALSSWAMLALVHHFIVQVAAWSIGYPKTRLFTRYALLGDDIVIGERDVANRYLALLAELGVECGIAKSILSHNGSGVEFAKRTFVDGKDVSPISLQELSVALSNISAWAAFVTKYPMDLSEQGRFLGYGFRVVKNDTGFRSMNAAFKVLFLSQIPRLSITAQFLNLNNKFPRDLEPLLPRFIEETLVPLRVQILGEALYALLIPKQDYYRDAWDKGIRTINFLNLIEDGLYKEFQEIVSCLQDFDNETLLKILNTQYVKIAKSGISIFRIGSIPTRMKSLIDYFVKIKPEDRPVTVKDMVVGYDQCLSRIVFSERPVILRALQRSLVSLRDLSSIKTMDEALLLYLTLLKDKATPNMSALLAEEDTVRPPDTVLPFQNRLFRSWSRLTYKLAKLTTSSEANGEDTSSKETRDIKIQESNNLDSVDSKKLPTP